MQDILEAFLEESPRQVQVIGVPVSVVTMESALAYTSRCFEQLRGRYFCAANVHTTVMAHEQADYGRIQRQAAMVLPDGKPLSVLGHRKTGLPMEKVTGLHFMRRIFTDPRFAGKRHFFYGTGADTLEAVICRLRQAYPELNICGYAPSVFRELSDGEVLELAERIRKSRADFIWIALGAPRQEVLMYRLKSRVDGIMCGVGGAFPILAHLVPEAPQWMQNAGLEWCYRLMQEPKRLFRRYLTTNSKFLYYLLAEQYGASFKKGKTIEEDMHDRSRI